MLYADGSIVCAESVKEKNIKNMHAKAQARFLGGWVDLIIGQIELDQCINILLYYALFKIQGISSPGMSGAIQFKAPVSVISCASQTANLAKAVFRLSLYP